MSSLDTRRIAIEERPSAVQPEGTLPAGTILQERYEILAVQGLGGMGAVYRARDKRFSSVDKIVAVKEMTNTAPDPRLQRISIQNFEREANILASLSHPAIPKIFDYFSEGNRSYLILEFVEGKSLERVLDEQHQPFSQEETVEWGIQICDVLAFLHNHRPPVIFRDVKPSNLMVRPDGRIMVIDFGIAKVFEHGQRGTMIGTEGYSPPEQYRGVAEPRGDLYALAATLHHVLTMRNPQLEPPFTFHERPIRLFNPNVSEELETVIMKALSYDVQDRYATATEFAAAMTKALPQSLRATGTLATGSMGTAAFASRQDVKPKWVFRCEDEVRSSPRISEAMLFIGSYDHNLYALDTKDGSFVWKFATEGGIASTACIHESTILIGSEDGQLYAISRQTGHMVWSCATEGRIRSSARVEYGHAFIGSDDGNLYAINIQSGKVLWALQTAGPVRSTPFIAGESVCFGSDDSYVYAADMRSARILWKYDTHRRVTSSPAVEGNLLYIGSADGNLYAFNLRSGWPVWRFRTKGYVISSPTVLGNTVFVGSADGFLYAVDADSGRQRWKYETGGAVTSSPVVANDIVYIGSNDGALHAIDSRQGRGLWHFETGSPIPSSPLVRGDTVYIGSTNNKVYALPA